MPWWIRDIRQNKVRGKVLVVCQVSSSTLQIAPEGSHGLFLVTSLCECAWECVCVCVWERERDPCFYITCSCTVLYITLHASHLPQFWLGRWQSRHWHYTPNVDRLDHFSWAGQGLAPPTAARTPPFLHIQKLRAVLLRYYLKKGREACGRMIFHYYLSAVHSLSRMRLAY